MIIIVFDTLFDYKKYYTNKFKDASYAILDMFLPYGIREEILPMSACKIAIIKSMILNYAKLNNVPIITTLKPNQEYTMYKSGDMLMEKIISKNCFKNGIRLNIIDRPPIKYSENKSPKVRVKLQKSAISFAKKISKWEYNCSSHHILNISSYGIGNRIIYHKVKKLNNIRSYVRMSGKKLAGNLFEGTMGIDFINKILVSLALSIV